MSIEIEKFNKAIVNLNVNAAEREEGLSVINELAQNGLSEAQYIMGLIHYTGQYGMAVNFKVAANWFILAAKQGSDDALIKFAIKALNGEGDESNAKMAFKAFSLSAELGNEVAENNLGTLYINGWGVEKDAKVAVQWYTKAAKHGYVDAQNTLGMIYWKAKGVEKDLDKAFFWLREATKAGHYQASISLLLVSYEKADHDAPYFKAYNDHLENIMIPIVGKYHDVVDLDN
jgi:TPR repeat protein